MSVGARLERFERFCSSVAATGPAPQHDRGKLQVALFTACARCSRAVHCAQRSSIDYVHSNAYFSHA